MGDRHEYIETMMTPVDEDKISPNTSPPASSIHIKPTPGKPLTARYLSKLPENRSGVCEKRSSSIWAEILPWIFPLWKKRYLCLIGNYLLRFDDIDGESPKGIPIPLDVSIARQSTEDPRILEVENLYKTYVMRFETDTECTGWLVSIRQRKLDAIRESMGHVPLKEEVRRVNKAASRQVRRKLQFGAMRKGLGMGRADDFVFNPIAYSSPGSTGFD